MQWGELDLEKRLWTLPRERVKNDRRHEVPLSPQAVATIRALPRISDRFVFSTNAESPVNDFGKNKGRLDELSGVSDWVLHDYAAPSPAAWRGWVLAYRLSKKF